LMGFWAENGPFHMSDPSSQTPVLNPYSWNKIANVLYLESPAGVGMSYKSGFPKTYSTDDIATAIANEAFLVQWYSGFSEYRSHAFYILGESYAGMYIPSLVTLLLTSHSVPNLRGFGIGNPCTSPDLDHNAFFDILATHAILPLSLQRDIISQCPPTARYILDNSCCQFNITFFPNQSQECINSLNNMYTLFSNNNLYDLYMPCITKIVDLPCDDATGITDYLNSDLVRKAIHAQDVASIGKWMTCSMILNYTTNYHDSLQFYDKIFKLKSPDFRIMIYSGDVDACVPYVGTQAWVEDLAGGNKGVKPVKSWDVWHVQQQVAGYSVKWKDLSYVTVKGSGHMVPQFKPVQAFTLFENYLNGIF